MRLILCNSHLGLAKIPTPPDETFAFQCFEDFSVGPLGDWNDPPQFNKSRSAFWNNSSVLDPPNGGNADYFVWSQILPRHDLVEFVEAGGNVDEFPEIYEFEDLVAKADTIELWGDLSVGDCLWRWYVVAVLSQMGVDRRCISLCLLPEGFHAKQETDFVSNMLFKAEKQNSLLTPILQSDWFQILRYWEAVLNFPEPLNLTLIEDADVHTQHTLAILAARHPNSETGLGNLQVRLLRSAKLGWTKMLHVVCDAMMAGCDDNDPVGLEALLAELGTMLCMDAPLIEMEIAGTMRSCQVRLTLSGATKLELIGD